MITYSVWPLFLNIYPMVSSFPYPVSYYVMLETKAKEKIINKFI